MTAMDERAAEELDPQKIANQLQLWFFRDISDSQRHKLLTLWFGKKVSDEAKPHGWQRRLLQRAIAALKNDVKEFV